MNLLAMVAVAALIFLEKNAPRGAVLARAIALPLIVAGCWLLLAPTAVTHLV
jgi:predicted metal-binding membrane protein